MGTSGTWDDEQRKNGKPTGPRKAPTKVRAAKTEIVRAEVEMELRQKAERVFDTLGLSSSEAIALFYQQTALHEGLPFDSRIPNDETLEAVRQVRTGQGLSAYSSVEEMRADLLKDA